MAQRPLNCTHCNQPCTVFVTLVAGGKADTYGLCPTCPQLALLAPETTLPSLSLGLKLSVPTPAGRGRCPSCGFRWEDFERTQRIGCPTCYETHQAHLNPTLSRIQPGVQHIGRRPQPTLEEKKAQLEQFKSQLKSAVQSEDFEGAAGLRDQIARLESEFSALKS